MRDKTFESIPWIHRISWMFTPNSLADEHIKVISITFKM